MMNNDLISKSALIEEIINAQISLESKNDITWEMNKKYHSGLAWAHRMVLAAPTIDAEPVRQGCEYCSGRRTEYYHTTNTKLYINTFGNAQVLETECNHCPPYSNCSLRGIPVRSAFIINYCPNCGRKLDGGIKDAAD